MESPSEGVRRPPHAITVQPNETVLTAFPYEPHSSLLNFLKGDPKVLGVSPLPSTGLPGLEKRVISLCESAEMLSRKVLVADPPAPSFHPPRTLGLIRQTFKPLPVQTSPSVAKKPFPEILTHKKNSSSV